MIFSHFRTANLSISFSSVDECTFYHFRRVNFEKLEDKMTMVVLISLRLLAVSENYLITFSVSKVILSYCPYWVMITRTLLGKGLTMSFRSMGRLYSLKIWWDLKLWRVYNAFYIPASLLKQRCLMKLLFIQTGCLDFVRLWR